MKMLLLIPFSAFAISCYVMETKAEDLYLKAREFRDNHDLKEAVLAYGRAEACAKKNKNDTCLANVYRDLGSIFLEAQDFPTAAEFYNKAAKAKGKEETYLPESKIEMIPEYLACFGLNKEASFIDSLIVSVDRDSLANMAKVFLLSKYRDNRFRDNYFLSSSLFKAIKWLGPETSLSNALNAFGCIPDDILSMRIKDKELAQKEESHATISSLHKYLAMSEAAIKADQVERQRKLILLLVLAMVAVFGVYAVFTLLQRKRIREEMATIEDLRKTLDNLPDYGNLRALVQKQLSPLMQLGNEYFSADSHGVKEKLFKEFAVKMETLRDDRKVFSSFEEILNACHDGVMKKLHADFPEMKPKTSNILAMLFLGLSYTDISLISKHHNPASLRTFKSHYKKVFAESGLPSAPLYLSLLERQ